MRGVRSAQLRQTLPCTTSPQYWPMPAGDHPWVQYTSPPQSSQAPPTAPAPAPQTASEPLASPQDDLPSVPINTLQPSAASVVSATASAASAAAQIMSGEMDEHTEAASTPQRKRQARESDELVDDMLSTIYPCKDGPGGCLAHCSLCSVYTANTVSHLAVRRRGLIRIRTWSLAMYTRPTTAVGDCLSYVYTTSADHEV